MGSRQAPTSAALTTPARRRTYRALTRAAAELMDGGTIPTVAEAAEAADVSRATAYRYFTTQSQLLQAVLDDRLAALSDEALDAITVRDPLELLLGQGLPALRANEAQLRAALRLSLQQWERHADGEADVDRIIRGGRIPLVAKALEPLASRISEVDHRRLAVALTLLFGIEAWVVLKDVWGLDDDAAEDVVTWAARALLTAAGA
jgi:AcrR family transcriptional regulator